MQLIRNELIRNLSLSGDDSRRLFHGRGHCFSGYEFLSIDYFPPVVEITLYQTQDLQWINELVCLICDLAGKKISCIVLLEKNILNSVPYVVWGVLPEQTIASEDGLQYVLDFQKGQNCGLFLDMRIGRNLVRHMARGKKVLNLFAYTCSFSVAAMAGEALQVVNLDMSRKALSRGRLNHKINGIDLRQVSFLGHELFKTFSKLKRLGPFDLVIIDPPTYQGKSFQVERDYPKLLRKLPAILASNAEIIACLNAPHLGEDFLVKKLQKEIRGRKIESLKRLPSFPECEDSTRGINVVRWAV